MAPPEVVDDLYATRVPEDTVLPLNQLCSRCAKFTSASKLLARLSRGEDIRIGTSETAILCTPAQLKDGYLGGCHLCALLWVRGGGRLLDPSNPTISETQVEVKLTARNPSIEYNISTLQNSTKKWWLEVMPPFM